MLHYAADAIKQSGLAAQAAGASANVALHGQYVRDTSSNVVNWVTQARDKALEALANDQVLIANGAMLGVEGLLDWALNGKDGSDAPVIDGGGARAAYKHGQLMAGYQLAFSTTPPSGLQVAPPATGDTYAGVAAKMGLIAALILLTGGALLLIRRRPDFRAR